MTALQVTVTAKDGRSVKMTANQADAIQSLSNTRKGGCASVIGYKPTTNWTESPVQDIQMITHFSTANLYARRHKAISELEFRDVAPKLAGTPKLGDMVLNDCIALFEKRKQMLLDSLQKTMDGTGSDAYREGHERCYAYIGDVKVHLVTEKVDGIKEPVMDGNDVIVDTIMVPYLELNTTVRQKGVRKGVNSGAPVHMTNLIESCLNKRSVIYKTLSLKADNFEAFRVDRKEFLPEDVTKFGDILNG
jgi:hypothetical protein